MYNNGNNNEQPLYYTIIIAMIVFFSYSCGKKNKVKTNNNDTFSNFSDRTGLTPEDNTSISHILSNLNCNYFGQAQTSNQRIKREFRASGGARQGANSNLDASWAPGKSGGNVLKTFIGRTGNADVMVIFQTTRGYDMDLYLCPARSNTTGTWLIGGDAQLSNFIFTGFNLDNDVNCGRGSIDAGSFNFFTNKAGTVSKPISKVCWR